MSGFELLKPICEGLSRSEITDLLSNELIRLRLTRKNAYSYWAHEVITKSPIDNSDVRIDFMHFEPADCHTSLYAGAIERGTFSVYEIKSCLDDIKSGHGLNFVGDDNWLVMPVEVYEPFKRERLKDRELYNKTSTAACLLYGRSRNGRAKFIEADTSLWKRSRRKPADELLLCMIRALIANSCHSNVDHQIDQVGSKYAKSLPDPNLSPVGPR